MRPLISTDKFSRDRVVLYAAVVFGLQGIRLTIGNQSEFRGNFNLIWKYPFEYEMDTYLGMKNEVIQIGALCIHLIPYSIFIFFE